MNTPWRVAFVASVGLLAIQWPGAFATAAHASIPQWLFPALRSLPIVLPLLLFALRRPRAPLWAGIAALFYFCMGIANFRVAGDRLDLLEVALSVVVVLAAGWPGIAAKIEKRRAASRANV
jgi:uncharacterized membrane protein